ncbi:hypothetical protein CLOLEP_01130 [[Clostridium] leptum DSM 753]|uniref:Uncharacterized protein n=1 Tax=[Clostridium] leptum DSM 753 TaxID=428125 RepID=A7VRE7_9FIRM|nr:hypothetical protein CLOLEP_01130 [[Clostridium] leptum DSM 753]
MFIVAAARSLKAKTAETACSKGAGSPLWIFAPCGLFRGGCPAAKASAVSLPRELLSIL